MTNEKSYYEKNKVRVCKKRINESIPKEIKRINGLIPEKVNDYYKKFPYEVYGDPIIKSKLRYKGIKEHHLEYQECYSAAMEAYVYSIHRCALCGYDHTEYYIRKMINIAIICGLVITRENQITCEDKGLKLISLEKAQC